MQQHQQFVMSRPYYHDVCKKPNQFLGEQICFDCA